MKKIIAIFTAVCALALSGCETEKTNISQNISFSSEETSTESKPVESVDSEPEENSGNSGEDLPQNENPGYVDFFQEKAVHTLKIEIESAAWNSICAAPKKKEYQHANITIDGKTISDCGLKTHGNSTLNYAINHETTRFPFKVKFDEYTDESFLGLDELVLCSNIFENSYARQYAGYEAFRAIGGAAPLCTFFNVYVNGELLGLYTGVEEIDSSFLERNFNSSKHNLYKTDEMATLTPNMGSWSVKQKKGSNTSRTDLKLLIKTLDEMPLGEKGNIENILDVNSALQYIAVGAVIHHCDGYGGDSAHNYCLYIDDGVFYMLPWDMDLCFYQTGYGFNPSDGAQMDIKSGLSGEASLSQRPLIYKLLAVEEYYKLYLQYCEEVTDWLKKFSESGVDELFALIDESVKNDPKNSYSAFKREFNHDYHYGFAGYIKERVEYLEKRIPEIYKEKGFSAG